MIDLDSPLPTYALLSRFRVEQADEHTAVEAVRGRLSAADEPFDDVTVEREEAPGTYYVVARFVLASLDGETAVSGLFETLRAAGLDPDEVWLDAQVG
jgi:hypothetical protein